MEPSADIVIALRGVRPTFELIFNPVARIAKERSFDANGDARVKEFEGRWELWDTDVDNIRYKVCTLESPGRQFKHPDMKFVELIRLVDPARYDGDLSKMVEAMVDRHNEDLVSGLEEATFNEVAGSMAEYFVQQKKGFSGMYGSQEKLG